MGIRAKLLVGIILTIAPALWFLVDWVLDDLTPQYRESTEEPLVDAAYVLANIAAASVREGQIDVALFREAFSSVYQQKFAARIYNFTKQKVDFRVYITDRLGVVLFDSFDGRAEGQDYSRWRDVRLTLSGEYGARTSRDIKLEPPSSIMYVAAPIIHRGELIGVLSLGKPTLNANQFVESAQQKIIRIGILCALSALFVGLLVSERIARPIRDLTSYAVAVGEGKRVALPKIRGKELKRLGLAFESMRDTLEGKKYVEHYVQTLTHEIKSPLAAIRGAVELLKERPPEDRTAHFLKNIEEESARVQDLIDKLLLLSKLEAQKQLEDKRRQNLSALLEEALNSIDASATHKQLRLECEIEADIFCLGDGFLLRQALSNILQNAVEFSPFEGTLSISLRRTTDPSTSNHSAEVLVTDDGPGVPAYAESRVFERFYSLPRPDSGRKSSGLGLSLVQEVALMHDGSVRLQNVPSRGVQARLELPTLPA